MDPIVRQKLRAARRHFTGEHFLALAAWALVLGFSVLVVFRALLLVVPTLPRFSPGTVGTILLLPLLFAALWAVVHWWSDRRVARALDLRAATRDRFLTALDLGPGSEPGGLASAAQREVIRFASTFPLPPALRMRVPLRRYLWVLLPLLLFVGLEVFQQVRMNRLAPEQSRAKELLAAVREAAAKHPEDEALQKEAEKLATAESQLETSSEPMREALRALADLKQSLAAQARLTAEESAALAKALSTAHPQLASDLRSGQQAAAADALAQLDPEAVAQALKEAARHVEKSRLRELSRSANREAQNRLVRMVAASGEGGSARSQFLAQVRDFQSGSSRPPIDAPSAPGQGEGDSPPGNEKSASGSGDDQPPGGAPGSENDRGRGSELAGEADPTHNTSGADELLPGISGDGASLVEMFRAAGGDDPEARQAYRSAYDSAQPAALDAVNREEIPPGSRILVQRYFKAIRPEQ